MRDLGIDLPPGRVHWVGVGSHKGRRHGDTSSQQESAKDQFVHNAHHRFRCSGGQSAHTRAAQANNVEVAMIAAIMNGETQLFEDLIRPYRYQVWAMALSYMKNEADAEDIAQEAFMKAFRHLSSFRQEAQFSSWLISITLNEAKNRIRRRDSVSMRSLDDYTDGMRFAPSAIFDGEINLPFAAIERKEVRLLLSRAIQALPYIYREVYLLRDVGELNSKQTADMLKISVASVKVRLHRARMMLKKHLAPRLLRRIEMPRL
jgi:RNA polymerase sigma-70 factor (ECF subfamily)